MSNNSLVRTLALFVALLAVPHAVNAEPCYQRLRFLDKWVVLPLSGAAGFRDAVSTVMALEQVKASKETGIVFKVFGIVPTENSELFAWIKGGSTAGVLVASGSLMTKCRAGDRWIGRIMAISHGLASTWAARHNDAIRKR